MGSFGRVAPAPVLEPMTAFARWWEGQPPVAGVDFGDLRWVRPISRAFGTDCGQVTDRYYVRRSADSCLEDIRGRVLEIGEDTYTRRYGGDKVERSDVLHVHDRNPQAANVFDLSDAPHVPDDSFGCTSS